MSRGWCGLLAAAMAALNASVAAVAADRPAPLTAIEALYADWLDATYASSTLAAGPATTVGGRDRGAWQSVLSTRATALRAELPTLDRATLSAEDRRAVAVIERTLADAPVAPAAADGDQSARRCATAADAHLERTPLSQALYACFEEFGNHIEFEGRRIVRSTALELLQELDSGERRRALFAALEPLFRHINADDQSASPYRRLLQLTAADGAAGGAQPIAAAARTVGASTSEVESWLVAVLDSWRRANPGPALEPWDYWQHYAHGVHALDALIPVAQIEALSARYYLELGANLRSLGVRHDLAVRAGKAPLAYADFVRIGRYSGHGWRPAISRVSANVEHGGLFVLNEIVHEDGHAIHMAAVRTRPAFFALGDDLFVEAFADVAAWNVAEPAWQQRYLGSSVPADAGFRALFGNVMLDVAWGLFELRMLRAPESDPNALWTEITSRYLNVVPHPELSWWALRVQLVDLPGYMINYGLGAIVTADLRARLRERAGPFESGNRGWYQLTSAQLLRFGASIETPELLRTFLGRPVSSAALLQELSRLAPAGN